MREIVLDTETTGLDPNAGHRIVEVGAIELINHVSSGNHFREYLNPDREMPEEAFRVHGLGDAFLKDKPRFHDIVEGFLDFIADSPLVIHNASFDVAFLNAELERAKKPPIDPARAIDTLSMARKRYPGAQVSLDALCRRFEIDNSGRTLHGALLDCELLAEVYLELRGGRQPGFELDKRLAATRAVSAARREPRPARPHAASAAELDAHAALLDDLKDPIWRH